MEAWAEATIRIKATASKYFNILITSCYYYTRYGGKNLLLAVIFNLALQVSADFFGVDVEEFFDIVVGDGVNFTWDDGFGEVVGPDLGWIIDDFEDLWEV
jgi:hypothetical protein